MRDSCRMSPVTLNRFSNYAAQNIVGVIKPRNTKRMLHATYL